MWCDHSTLNISGNLNLGTTKKRFTVFSNIYFSKNLHSRKINHLPKILPFRSVQSLNERNLWRNLKRERKRFSPLFWPCFSTTVFADLIYQFDTCRNLLVES